MAGDRLEAIVWPVRHMTGNQKKRMIAFLLVSFGLAVLTSAYEPLQRPSVFTEASVNASGVTELM